MRSAARRIGRGLWQFEGHLPRGRWSRLHLQGATVVSLGAIDIASFAVFNLESGSEVCSSLDQGWEAGGCVSLTPA